MTNALARTLATLLLVGCGAAAPRVARIEPLPALPFALEDGPRELRTAWQRAEALLAQPAPAVPASFATLDEAGTWASETVLPWAHEHLEQMSDVTDPLAGAVALDGTLRVFAASIAAALYERLLEVLLHVPIPAEIEGDPELVAGYQAAFADALGSAVEDTAGLLDECVAAAAEREGAAAWGQDCADRRARLP